MPINKAKYPSNWKEIAKGVKDAAGWKCQWCGVAHGEMIASVTSLDPYKEKLYKVVLTTAHVGANKRDKMDTSQLVALCQDCHLREDTQERVETARATRRKKRLNKQPLLVGIEAYIWQKQKY